MKINTEQRLCFLIRISSVNVTKSAVYCGFGHLLNKSLKEKFSFFLCSMIYSFENQIHGRLIKRKQ